MSKEHNFVKDGKVLIWIDTMYFYGFTVDGYYEEPTKQDLEELLKEKDKT